MMSDVAEHHRRRENRLALFQVASQLNCLEFPTPDTTPEEGVTGYFSDRTQGPCCAIACGAATVFRNYFAPVRGAAGKPVSEGQTADCQVENPRDLAAALENDRHDYLLVQGGFPLASDWGLLARAAGQERDGLRAGCVREGQVARE